MPLLPFGSAPDTKKVKVSSSDISGFLDDKIEAGSGITKITTGTTDKKISLSVSTSFSDDQYAISLMLS